MFALLALLAGLGPLQGAAATMDDRPAACKPNPDTHPVLYLRGSMNNWATLEEYVFSYSCDAYYLNVELTGRHEFKVADDAWAATTTFGGQGGGADLPSQGSLALARGHDAGNVAHVFTGAHTLRLVFAGGQPALSIGPKSFADPVRRVITDPVALSLRHDSRDLAHRRPFGAIVAGGSIEFAIDARPGIESVQLVIEKRRLEGNQDLLEYLPVARLEMTRTRLQDGGERWSSSHAFAEPAVYGYYFLARIGGVDYAYQNNRHAVYWTREQGSNGLGVIAAKPAGERMLRRYRMTVHAPGFVVPDWAADAVYYYVFPERFRNGDPGNDPRPGVDRYQDKDVEFHENWLDRPWRPGTGDGSDTVHNNDFFGGDLAGIIEQLDYIAGLGANTLYMTPVFLASSNHKYDTADYTRVDPRFGSNSDFERLAAEAGKRGIRVMPDVSLNHTGSDSIYFDRFGKYGGNGAFAGGRINPDSPYADWYRFDPAQSDPDKQYKGWVGVKDLPELNKDSPGFRRFAYGAPDSVMKQWLDRGAAGWRMDVAPWVPDDFWREWRAEIKQHRPDALLIAETWFDASKFFLGDAFDGTMNYVFRNAVLDYANGGKASDAYRSLEYLREVYPPQALHALMNLVSSHDVARALHVFGHTPQATPEAVAVARQRLRLAWLFQVAYPGAPAIYYGDEVGVTGGEDPFNRATYPWPDRGGQPDLAMKAELQRLLGIRREHAVLRRGTLSAPLLADAHLLAFARQGEPGTAIVVLNNDAAVREARLPLPADLAATHFEDLLTGETFEARQGQLALPVPARFGRILVPR